MPWKSWHAGNQAFMVDDHPLEVARRHQFMNRRYERPNSRSTRHEVNYYDECLLRPPVQEVTLDCGVILLFGVYPFNALDVGRAAQQL